MSRFIAFIGVTITASVAMGAEPMAETQEQATRRVVQAVAAKAAEIRKRPAKDRPAEDALTEAYIREAARAAGDCEASVRASAFLIGIGIALDDSTTLSANPLTKKLCAAAESAEERKARIANLGSPTIHKRRDLCQHFAVSAALAAIFGPALAELAGVAKEQADMNGTSGFSFADLCVDLAGIELATRLKKSPASLAEMAKEFSAKKYVPSIEGLKEGMNAEQFKKDYGNVSDARYQRELDELRKRVAAVEAYKK